MYFILTKTKINYTSSISHLIFLIQESKKHISFNEQAFVSYIICWFPLWLLPT